MSEKQNNDKSFEQKSQQKRRSNPAGGSVPTASYREIRAKSESERKKKSQVNQPKAQNSQADKRRTSQEKKPVRQNPQSQPESADKINKNHSQQSVQVKSKQSADGQPKQRKKPQNPSNDTAKNEHKASVNDSTKKSQPKSIENQPDAKLSSEKTAKPKKRKIKRSSKPFSAKKRRRKIFAMYTSMVMIIAMIAAVLCLTVFFKIDSITVEGKTRYSTDEIIDASGIAIGTNLLLCNTEPSKEIIAKEFPYIESVSIKKNPFNSITIYVEEAKPTTAIETNGKFYILSAKGKIIEILDSNKYNVPLIKGAELKKTELSATIEYKLENMNNIINSVMEALTENKVTEVSTINVTNPSNIKLSYDKRLTIILGMPENISYKVKTAKVIIDEKLEKDSKGTVDVSMCAEGGKYSYYDPSGAPEN